MSALFCAAAGVAPSSASAQVPQKFDNLQVLPKDIPRDSLRALMRGFASALGVQCAYCHTGGDTVTLVGVNFASDLKLTKQRAREMYQMVQNINSQLDASELPRTSPIRVECATCHHGLPRPEGLQAVLMRTIATAGIDAAAQQYRDLRTRYLTRGRYDFGEASLNILADQLVAQKRPADAIRMLELNREFNPDAPTLSFQLAELYREAGERERARELYRLVTEKQPRNLTAHIRLGEVSCTRTVTNNTIKSTRAPVMTIAVDTLLEYVGCQSYVIKGNARAERYHFVEIDDNRNVVRLFVAHFEEALPNTDLQYGESIPRDRRGEGFLISASPVRLGKNAYIHNVRFYDSDANIKANPDVESSRSMLYLKQFNLNISPALGWSRFMRALPGAREEILFFYFEPIATSGFTLADFKPKGRGEAGLDRAAAAMLERSKRAFRIISE